MRRIFFAFLLIANTSYAQVNLTQGLVAYYPFSGNANDASGNNINGVVNNATLTTDRNGQLNSAYYFDGSTSSIQLPYSNLYNFAPTGSFSISVWIQPDQGNPDVAEALVVKSPYNSNYILSNWNYGIYDYGDQMMAGYAATNFLIGTTSFSTNQCWYNLVETYTNGMWTIYVNGNLENSDNTQTHFILQDNESSIDFGKKGEADGDYYQGKMDEVRIYNRVLNQQEVTALSQQNNPCVPISQPQFCTGTLGAPVVNITFGQGSSNPGPQLSSVVAGASTSYNFASYATATPPAVINDGDYALVNEVPVNSAWFTGATDHTGNPNGYMAFFNAAPTPGVFYSQTITGLCPGTTYQFAAWIADVDNPAVLPGAILPNITFQILDPTTQNVLGTYNTGDIPMSNSMTWVQYSSLFVMPSGLNSVTLVLSNNSIGGNANPGNDLAMDDITFSPCGPTTSASIASSSICPNGSVNLSGNVSSGLTNPAYQWQISSDSGATFTNINGATSLNYLESGLLPGYYQFQLLSAETGNINASSCRFVSNTVTLSVDSLNFDFSYAQNVCNPLIVQFQSGGNDSLNPFFAFGDGVTSNGKTIVSHTYSSPGNYILKYSAQSLTGCTDTITKIIAVKTVPANIIITPDTTICYGNTKQIRTQAALDFCWSPTTYLDDPTLANPTTSAPKTTTYYFTAEVQGNNLIQNGNFDAGNTGFTSQYAFDASGLPAGVYFVGTNPNAWNPGMSSSCVDHTGAAGNGNEMLVNGAAIPNVIVWSETIPVTPNTNYAFSAWAQNLTPNDPTTSSLQFSINGNLIGNVFTTNFNICIWGQFYSTWNSGNATTATISIVNNTLVFYGNDFALDDLSFTPVNIEKDSVIINVDTPTIKTRSDTSVCFNSPVQLNTTGATNYLWTPTTGLSDATVGDPVATPSSTTKYIVTGTDINGCTASDSVTITLSSSSLNVSAGDDSLVCKNTSITLHGDGTGVSQYAWSPKEYLNDSSLQSPTATIDTTTKFYLSAKNAAGCTGKDSVLISVQNLVVKTNNDTAICAGKSLQLNTSGALTYSWSPTNYLSISDIAGPVATPPISTQYIVTGTSAIGCMANDTIMITINQLPQVETTNDTAICINSSAQLNTTGAANYLWFAANGLSKLTIANPVATPITTTQYFVTGTDTNGCAAEDSVTIKVNPLPVIIISNDTSICQNTSVQLSAAGGVTYQWQSTPTLNKLNTATPVATPTGDEIYHVSVTGSNSCVNTDSVEVSIRPLPVFTVSGDTSVCTTAPVQLNAGGGNTYLWSPASLLTDPSIPNPLTNATTTTTYSVQITESTCNNSTTLTTTVTLQPPLQITTTKSNDLNCSNGSAQLTVSGANWYTWSPGKDLNDSTISNPIASSLTTQQYIVKGTDADGCTGYDTIIVYANYDNDSSNYYLPNAFTPNGDGLNDCFGIKFWGLVEKLDFVIYDRWGNKVFYTNNPGACWDGTYNGQPANVGNYIYYISAITACGQVTRKGNVILIR